MGCLQDLRALLRCVVHVLCSTCCRIVPDIARFPPLWDGFAFVALLWFGVDLHADRVSRGGSAQAKVGLLCSNPVSCADVPGVLEQQVSQPGPRFDTSAPFPDVLAEKRRQLGEYLSLSWWNLPRQNTKCHLWSVVVIPWFRIHSHLMLST